MDMYFMHKLRMQIITLCNTQLDHSYLNTKFCRTPQNNRHWKHRLCNNLFLMKDLLGVIKHRMEYIALSAGTFLKKAFPEAKQSALWFIHLLSNGTPGWRAQKMHISLRALKAWQSTAVWVTLWTSFGTLRCFEFRLSINYHHFTGTSVKLKVGLNWNSF